MGRTDVGERRVFSELMPPIQDRDLSRSEEGVELGQPGTCEGHRAAAEVSEQAAAGAESSSLLVVGPSFSKTDPETEIALPSEMLRTRCAATYLPKQFSGWLIGMSSRARPI